MKARLDFVVHLMRAEGEDLVGTPLEARERIINAVVAEVREALLSVGGDTGITKVFKAVMIDGKPQKAVVEERFDEQPCVGGRRAFEC